MSRIVIMSLFAMSGLAFAVIELLARRENSSIPTLGDIGGFIMAYQVGRVPVGRVALLGFWWWVGWHFFAR